MPPPPPTSSGQHRRELIERGFTIFPGVISPSLLRGLQTAVEERVHTMAHYVRPDGKKHTRHKGDHLHLVFNRKVLRSPMGGAGICHPLMTELVAHPGCMAALDDVGCEDKKFWSVQRACLRVCVPDVRRGRAAAPATPPRRMAHRGSILPRLLRRSGYVLSKPPGGPPLYWHNDWSFWEDPVSAKAMPSQMFGMVYLCDTSRQNGCLRVQPRSHRRPSGVWQAVQENNHLQKLKRRGESNPASVMEADTANFNDPIFAAPGEDVPMRAGDLLLGDSRLLHGTHANDSDARRTCITLWYLSNFRGMSPRVRMGFANEWEVTSISPTICNHPFI
jgi:hypothetical protein